ncbi:MAG: hypothetical protein CMJ78_15515 [Planctomycetaceae bacterium]|nr:hypothetical protein [Planctomycetaceae bacterium]
MDQAERLLRKALALHQSGAWAEARDLYMQVLQLDPDHAGALQLLGGLMLQCGDLPTAIDCLSRAVDIAPHVAPFHENLGVALRTAQRPTEAVDCLLQALALEPRSHSAHSNLGGALCDLGKLEEAVAAYQNAIQLSAKDAEYHLNLGLVYSKLKEYEKAEASMRRALQLLPKDSWTLQSLGGLLCEMDRPEEALRYLGRVNRNPESLVTTATCQLDLGDTQKAIEAFDEAVRVAPGYSEAIAGRALAFLHQGDFGRGWKDYAARKQVSAAKDKRPRSFAEPEWDGGPLQDFSLIVYAEQGIGEEIMFASCFPDLFDKVDKCLVECDERLIPLYERSFPTAEFTRREFHPTESDNVPRADFHTAIGDLPRFFRPRESAFPDRAGFLKADEEAVAEWRDRTLSLGGDFVVGISWRGGKVAKVHRRKSTTLDQWTKVLFTKNVTFVNLQYGDCQRELQEVYDETGIRIHHFDEVDPLQQLDEWAALVASLDLVISTSNATVHMAGALGTRVWNLLPEPAEWRWMSTRDDSPWYPLMQLFRQSEPGDWDSVFESVAEELAVSS